VPEARAVVGRLDWRVSELRLDLADVVVRADVVPVVAVVPVLLVVPPVEGQVC